MSEPSHFVFEIWNGQTYEDSEQWVEGVFSTLADAVEEATLSPPQIGAGRKDDTHTISEFQGTKVIATYAWDGVKIEDS